MNYNRENFGWAARILHWSSALVVLSIIAAIEIKGQLPKGALKHALLDWHFQAGIASLVLLGLRLIFRMRQSAPRILPPPSPLSSLCARLVHITFYLLLFSLPLLGILAKESRGLTVEFFGHPLPILLDEERGLPYSLAIRNFHEFLGNLFIALIILHVAAAIYHHLIRRDNALRRMFV